MKLTIMQIYYNVSTLFQAFFFFFFFLHSCSSKSSKTTSSPLQTYIVHVQPPKDHEHPISKEDLRSWHMSFLQNTIATTDNIESIMIYSYHTVISGFAAKLSPEQLKVMKTMNGFIYAYPDKLLPLLTTYTPDFLGLRPSTGLWNTSNSGENIIIGVLDTGVYPHHPSFRDEGMTIPIKNWGNQVSQLSNFTCNSKIIGAKAFTSLTADDDYGHGTHTASTTAGNFVKDANLLGNIAEGIASGMAPRAHLAIYKVCDESGCLSSDILAGMDAAIIDGVNIMSLSLGGSPEKFSSDPVAQGAFRAMEKGIFVSCAAGNFGPYSYTLSNEAPWLLTVAASTTDRRITANVQLGDGQEFSGESLFQPSSFSPTLHQLVLPSKYSEDMYCDDKESLGGQHVKGKIVVCRNGGDGSAVSKGEHVKEAGGIGMILINDDSEGSTILADIHVLPASRINYADGVKIVKYIKNTKKPMAAIAFHGTKFGASPAPAMVYFSSRGPSVYSSGILKPDITGPGVNILAAWPFKPDATTAMVRDDNNEKRFFFNVISGTSMSTPHLSGVAALIKSEHKSWSPAMIKSAIMTTSNEFDLRGEHIVDETQKKASFFSMGAGHVNPQRACDPGLVYDIAANDYIPYICGLGYTDQEVGAIVGRKMINCSIFKKMEGKDLNYPSISVVLGSKSVTVMRTVINVGEAQSVYTLKVDKLVGVSIEVKPSMLNFSQVNEKKSFTVSFISGGGKHHGSVLESNLRWISEKHVVRSPISIRIST